MRKYDPTSGVYSITIFGDFLTVVAESLKLARKGYKYGKCEHIEKWLYKRTMYKGVTNGENRNL